ncbi:cytochrome P450 [Auricularia subglabra TFB-10046 SS5]|uniref:Cytochrome P450 n=1 Tax=Auricularia subglabra (strain TFB-10046 / SS5) TaxID=717982 RepID=J0WU80_AURST|nr:cytochrome P450 [Auricularia subglabra TFB-10046 SS5]
MAVTPENVISLAASPLQYLSWVQLALSAVGALVAYQAASLVFTYWRHTRSPLRKIPGPALPHNWLTGSQHVFFDGEGMQHLDNWGKTYGGNFTLRSTLGSYQLVTTDERALTHVIFATGVFHKRTTERRGLLRLLGQGILYTEGEQHRDHRRILNPAFGYSHVRDMNDQFIEIAIKMREIWHNKCIAAGGTVQLDALSWLSKATLDSIGIAGFGYDFGALNENGVKNELYAAFERLLRVDNKPTAELRALLENLFPILRRLAPSARARETDLSKKLMDDIGMGIVQEKKKAVLANMAGSRVEKKAMGGKDILSLLIQANLAEDLPATQRLTDEEVMAEIPSFILAGHETTANSTTWALYSMSLSPDVQEKLRQEILQVGTETPSLDTLNSLPYLDNVVRETLRLHSVATFVGREAVQDDIVPFGRPVLDRDGNEHTQLKLQKGDQIIVPISLVNRSTAIWGPDADKFRPERWDSVPQGAASIPGIAPSLLSFIGGPRACIGHRFAVAEMKALLFHIVRGFKFSLAIDKSELWSRTGTLLRPQLRKDNSVQLPLLVTPIA